MKKRILSLFAMFAILLGCLPSGVQVTAGAKTWNGWEYTVSKKGEVTIWNCNLKQETVTVPAYIKGKPVVALDLEYWGCEAVSPPVFKNKVRQVILPDTMRRVNLSACSNKIETIRISKSVQEITMDGEDNTEDTLFNLKAFAVDPENGENRKKHQKSRRGCILRHAVLGEAGQKSKRLCIFGLYPAGLR